MSQLSRRLDQVLAALLAQTPEIEAAAVVSYDGLPMASALPAGMDEDRVAAMSAALLSLGERAAEGLGRGALSQVYIEGEQGTVFLVSAEDEAVLVAVAAQGAKAGLMLYEVRRAAAQVAAALREGAPASPSAWPDPPTAPTAPTASAPLQPTAAPVATATVGATTSPQPTAAPVATATAGADPLTGPLPAYSTNDAWA